MGMFDETSLPAAYFLSASNAAHAAFTGLFSLRRVHLGYELMKRVAAVMQKRLEATLFQVLDVYAVKK